MSFEIIFYKNRSEPNRLDKTSYLDRYTQISGVLRNSTSIISPTIDIQFEWRQDYIVDGQGAWVISDGKKVILATIEELLQCNYCYIEAFKRYYYITDIVSIRQGLWSISMSVDVFMSYKDIILEQNCLVQRNEYTFDNKLRDSLLPSRNDMKTFVLYSNIFYSPYITEANGEKIYNEYVWNFTDYHWIVTTMVPLSDDIDFSYDLYYSPNINKNLYTYYFSNGIEFNKFTTQIVNPDKLTSLGNSFGNPADYISAMYLTPFNMLNASENGLEDFMAIGQSSGVTIGNIAVEASAHVVFPLNRLVFFCTVPRYEFNDFTDYPPYSKYFAYIPFIGIQEIDGHWLAMGFDTFKFDVDVTNGDLLVTLINSSSVKNVTNPNPYLQPNAFFIKQWKGNCYISLSLGSTNKNELERLQTERALSFGVNSMGSVLDLISGSGSAQMIANRKVKGSSFQSRAVQYKTNSGFISDMFGNVSNYLIGEIINNVPTGSSQPTMESILEGRNLKACSIFKIQPNFYRPDNYDRLVGRPLMQYKTLKDLNGFTVVSDIQPNNFENATVTEIEEIIEILQSGVILP